MNKVELITQLRNKTGAGMLMVKKALEDAEWNIDKATTLLRERGESIIQNSSTKEVPEGLVSSYIHHGGKIGVLLEVRCETDFVARNEEFTQFVKDLCLHIASAAPKYINREEVPEKILSKEMEIFRAQVIGKPLIVIKKIVDGKMEKFYKSCCLLEQEFVKDSSKTILQLLDEQILKTRENIQIKRFARFSLKND